MATTNYAAIVAKVEQQLENRPLVEWVNRKEAAEVLAVDVRTFRRWERLGATPFSDLPFRQHRYYRRSDIEALAESRRVLKAKRLAKRGSQL